MHAIQCFHRNMHRKLTVFKYPTTFAECHETAMILPGFPTRKIMIWHNSFYLFHTETDLKGTTFSKESQF